MQISELSLEETEMVNGAGPFGICDNDIPPVDNPCETDEFRMDDIGHQCL